MRRLTRDRILSIALITPSALALLVFVYGFIGLTAFASLTKWDALLPDFTFVGLRNYAKLFSIQRFQLDLRNTVTFTLFFLLACLVIGFLLAVLIDQRIRGESLFRSIFLFPMAISFVVTGVVWRWLLAPGTEQTGSYGVNLLFEQVGLHFLKNGWYTAPIVWHLPPDSFAGGLLNSTGLGFLTSPMFGIPWPMFSIVIAATWQMSGYTMALYLAGLRGIPDELREAARMDGASEFQVYRHIIVPLLTPITLSAVIVLGHISLKIFDLVVAMTGSGPGFSTDVPAFYMFDTTFRGNHFAQGAGIAMIILLVVAVLVIPYLIYSARTEVQQ